MGWSPALSLGPLGLLGQSWGEGSQDGVELGTAGQGAKVKLLLMSADGPPPQGESWGSWGGERPRQPHARWKEGKMVTEASNEGMREKTVTEKSQDQSPWRWHPEDQEGLGMCHSPPHSLK